jgi:hypothetical protein
MNKYAIWFGRIVWLGILADWVLAIPAIFFPNETLAFVGQRPSQDPVWTSFSGVLLTLLAAFYIPAARNPYRHRLTAWLTVFARTGGIFLFLLLRPGIYPLFGFIDMAFLVTEGPLLIMAFRTGPGSQGKGDG